MNPPGASAARHTTIIAEMSANHCQSLDTALDIVREVARAGADVVKTQTYKASTLTCPGPSADYIVDGGTIWDGQRLEDLYAKAEMPWEFNRPIMQLAGELGLGFLSTAYDPSSVEYLEKLGVERYKVASFEITDLPLIRLIGQTKKPLILSTGMASASQIYDAMESYNVGGGSDLTLLACCSAYPAPLSDMNVLRVAELGEMGGLWPIWTHDLYVGLSDHSIGSVAACAAVALGAAVLEKHAGKRPGNADSSFSASEAELAMYVRDVRTTESVLGTMGFELSASEQGEIKYQKSLYFIRDIEKGETIQESDLKSYRPALGIFYVSKASVIGRKAACHISAGTPVQVQYVE